VRSAIRGLPAARFVLSEVTGVDLGGRAVRTEDGAVPYDFLILAVGSTSYFFGIPGAAECAFPLKTLEDGIRLRNQILRCFERAARAPEPREGLLTFAIVGGGPTGVEFAGALAELIRRPLRRDYPALDFGGVRIVLLESLSGLLPGLPGRLSAYALQRLTGMGVEVRLNATVSGVSAHAVTLLDGTTIPTETVVWTAGVRGVPLADRLGVPTGRGGRVPVSPTLQLSGYSDVYVVGDLAQVEGQAPPLPMVAPVAIQQATAAARNIGRQMAGTDPLPFRYKDPGTMVTIGRNAAVAHVRGQSVTGFPAWVLWLGVHLFNLVGFRNRILVMINWAWDYFLYERAVRLILPSADNMRGGESARTGPS